MSYVLTAVVCGGLGFVLGLNTHRFLIRSAYRVEDALEAGVFLVVLVVCLLGPALLLRFRS